MRKQNKTKLDPIMFFEQIGKLKKIQRTGWMDHGIINPESVADHSFMVSTIAYSLSKDLKCNPEKLIKMALIHDIAESVIGDLVVEHGSITDNNGLDEKRRKESDAMRIITKIAPLGDEMLSLWDEYEQQKSNEAKILKQIDKLEMVIQALKYEDRLEPEKLHLFWENAKKHITHPLLLNIFKRLCQSRTPPYNSYDAIGRRFL